jgi:hypothetical protein
VRRLATWSCIVALAACHGNHGLANSHSGTIDRGQSHYSSLAHIIFDIRDKDTQQPSPSRVIFRPVPGAGFADSVIWGFPDPGSAGSRTGAGLGPGVIGSPEGVLLETGQGVVQVPAGQYTLFITRGPEYEAVTPSVVVGAGEVSRVTAELDRTVDTRGWLAADMHVHTALSFDSRVPIDRRVVSMVTNGVEIMVPTDHHANTDLQSAIDMLGYGPELVGQVIGNELNFKEGHAGVYPVVYDVRLPGNGSLPYQPFGAAGACAQPQIGINCYSGATAFARMHAILPGTTVVVVNHPWWQGGDLGFFTNIGWGAGTPHPLPAPLDAAGAFDALEVMNGYWARSDAESYLTADWFWLLQQGHRVTALGNSDTHKINWIRAGYPRTWLRLPVDRPGDITGPILASAIRGQRAIASNGPFITLAVDGAQIGDTVVPKTAGQVTVDIVVDAPGWLTVDTVRLYVNGVEAQAFAVEPGRRPVFTATVTVPITEDTFIVAHASGRTPIPGDIVGEYSRASGYDVTPWAITNPVFVDANGDGQWRPVPSATPPAGPPIDPGDALAGAKRRRPEDDPLRDELRVPVECEPGANGEEPALTVPPIRQLMPLLDP